MQETVNAYIQAVPCRGDMVTNTLLPSLEGIECISDASVYFDYDYKGPLYNFMCIVNSIAEEGKPSLIIQDDSVLHKDIGLCLPSLIRHLTEMKIISLFCPPRGVYKDALDRGFNWVKNYKHLWQPAIMMLPEVAIGLREFSATYEKEKHDDVLLRDYLHSRSMPVWVTVPSLVQHNINVKSVVGNPSSIGKIGKRVTRIWQKDVDENYFDNINYIKA